MAQLIRQREKSMSQGFSLLLGLGFCFLFPASVFADYVYSGNRCHTHDPGTVVSKCRGREMPRSKMRNFDHSSHQLKCTSNSNYFIRKMQDFDFNKWYQMIKAKQIDQAHELRISSQPKIEWQGKIPYQTVETWHWQTCETGQSSSECGTHQDRKTRQVAKQRCKEVGSGKKKRTSCETYYVTETYYETHANTCEYDHDQYEAWQCSNESMSFNAQFDLDPNWKPKGPAVDNPTLPNKKQSYHYALPHKYDLLQGENELIQVFNTSDRSQSMTPTMKVGDAWNHYSTQFQPSQFMCQVDSNYHFNLNIRTDYRLTDKASPNAFKAPASPDGRPLSPFNWKGGKENTQPNTLILMDSSAAMIQLIAEESRANADLQETLLAKGKGTNPDGLSEKDQFQRQFFKNTQIRIGLRKINRMWWKTSPGYDFISDETTSIVPSTNYTSENQEIRYSDMWEISLDDIYDRDKNAWTLDFSRAFGKEVHLIPNRMYEFQVSMYQKGMPFYKTSCEDESQDKFDCSRWSYPLFMHRSESDYFSKPLMVQFETDKLTDERNFLQKIFNVGDWVVGKRAGSN